MRVLRILVAVVFLLCAVLSSAQQSDQKVSKAIPDSCQHTATRKEAEENETWEQGGNVNRQVGNIVNYVMYTISYTVVEYISVMS